LRALAAPAIAPKAPAGCLAVARALIVGCGCRGRDLGIRLVDAGWQVRGTTRNPAHLAQIEAAGIEAAQADPDRAASVLDHVADVTIVYWLMGSALGEPALIAAINGPRLERVLERLVDSPLRGFVYEAAGSVERDHRERGGEVVRDAAARWRIPVEIVDADPADPVAWTASMVAAAERLVS
jgi:nucleoside-diphosphate-sugar epimerase